MNAESFGGVESKKPVGIIMSSFDGEITYTVRYDDNTIGPEVKTGVQNNCTKEKFEMLRAKLKSDLNIKD